MRLRQLRNEKKAAVDAALAIAHAAKQDGRDNLTAAEQTRFDAAKTRADELTREIDALEAQDGGRESIDEMLARTGLSGSRREPAPGHATGSFGQQFTASTAFREAAARQFAGGMAPVELSAQTLTSVSGGAALVQPHVLPGLTPQIFAPASVSAIVPVIPVTGDVVRTIVETTATNAAAEVSDEGTEDKPESTFEFGEVDVNIRTIATVLGVTNQILQDAPATAAYLDQRLRLFVNLRLDNQILNGTGGDELVGILGRGDLAPTVGPPAGSETVIDVIAAQLFAIMADSELVPSHIVMNSKDWAQIATAKNDNGDYFSGSPFAAAAPRSLFGTPVVLSARIPQGTALVGAFDVGSARFARTTVSVAIATQHADYFVRNKSLIRAEMRTSGAHLFRPAGFGLVELS